MNNPTYLAALAAISSMIGVLFIIPNAIQTYLFESSESNENLQKNCNAEYDPIKEHNETQSRSEHLKKIIDFFLRYTQSPLHGACDTMPVYQTLTRTLHPYSLPTQLGISIPILLSQFCGSLFGNQKGEVEPALNELWENDGDQAQERPLGSINS